jgi:arabinan endo-1,5-alpha-L-arabinosidase
LDPQNGLTLNTNDRGIRIAHRGFTEGTINGNIEAPEIIYNPDQGMYYLFIAYDWLETKYNIRVGRSSTIEGPYYDMFGNDLYDNEDNYPMIVAPYKFNSHSGWQGVSHCTVFEDNGQYYVAHQGRPGENFYYMDLHVRQLFWTEDGWPVASPERYAGHEQSILTENDLVGIWELIDFEYTVVPGFADEQTSPDFQTSQSLLINADGTLNASASDTWSYDDPWMTLTIDGISTDVHVSIGRDWENNIDSTLVFTGNNPDGMPLWGKKN